VGGHDVPVSTEPVELPDPVLMWSRWAAFGAALACLEVTDVWWVDDAGAHVDDHGGSSAHLLLAEDGGALWYGWDRDDSETGEHAPPIDLLADAPDWAPFEELGDLAAQEFLGWVHWYAPDTGWRRAAHPPGVEDGRDVVLRYLSSDTEALAELREVQTDWAEHDPGDEAGAAALTAAGERLLAAAVRGDVDAAVLRALFPGRDAGAVDVSAGLGAAARGGLVPGSTPPRRPADVRERRRPAPALTAREHARLVHAVARAGYEAPRPVPAATPELEALTAAVRAAVAPGRTGALLVEVRPGSTGMRSTGDLDVRDVGRAVSGVPLALCDAEAGASGRWTFLAVVVRGTGPVRVWRAWDTVPPWWPHDGFLPPHPDPGELVRRPPAWRPRWMELALEASRTDGIPAAWADTARRVLGREVRTAP